MSQNTDGVQAPVTEKFDGGQGGGLVRKALEVLAPYGVPLVLLVLIVIFSLWLPNTFPTVGNFQAMATSNAVVMLLALAVLFPLRTGEFDLSVGANMIFCSVVCGLMVTKWGFPVPVAIAAAVGIGALIGAVNAFLVVGIGISGFVATLGTMTILEGLSIAVSHSQIVIGLPAGMLKLGQSTVWNIPVAVVYGWVAAIIVWYVYRFVPYGRYLLFVGGNPDASRLAGIPVARIRFTSLVICGLISGIASVVLLTTYGAVNPTGASEFLISPYTAAFLGIAAVQIGRFNVVGTIFALYLVTVGVTGLQLLGTQQWVTHVFNGSVLVLAVGLSRLLGARRV